MNGMRINLDEIEQAAQSLGCVAAIAQTDTIVLFAATVPNRDSCRNFAASFGLPPMQLKWRALEKLPLTGSGKIDYRALEQLS
jgi:hypothetical protein